MGTRAIHHNHDFDGDHHQGVHGCPYESQSEAELEETCIALSSSQVGALAAFQYFDHYHRFHLIS